MEVWRRMLSQTVQPIPNWRHFENSKLFHSWSFVDSLTRGGGRVYCFNTTVLSRFMKFLRVPDFKCNKSGSCSSSLEALLLRLGEGSGWISALHAAPLNCHHCIGALRLVRDPFKMLSLMPLTKIKNAKGSASCEFKPTINVDNHQSRCIGCHLSYHGFAANPPKCRPVH